MADKMWFGHARGHMQYVPCPLIDSSVTRNRYLERIQFENGGGDGRRSNQHQMQYDFQFSGLAHEVDGIDAFNKYAQGFYGDDLIHLAHPAAFETNLFPAGWATPSLSEKGWGKISTDAVAYSNADGPSVTNLVTNPSMEGVTAGTDSTKRTNLVTNPNSETSALGTAGAGAGAASLSTTQKVSGTNSTKFVWTSGNWGAQPVNVAVTAGTTYTASFYIFSESGSIPSFVVQNQSYATVTSTGVYTTSTVGSWVRLNMTFTPAAGTTSVLIYGTTSSAATYYIDNVLVEAAPDMRSYFDGNYSEDPTLIEAWTGTVNNSTSTALVRGASNRENLVTNPSLEVDATGYKRISTGGNLTTRVTTQAYSGSASLEVALSNSDGAFFDVSGLTASNTYTFSVWVKGTFGDTVRVDLNERVNYATNIATTSGNLVTLTGSWQRLSVTRTFGATGVYARLVMRNVSATSNPTYWDAVMLEQSTVVNPYFDGSYTDAPGWTTSWAGTANASRSVATAAPVTVRTNLVTNPSMETVTPGTVVMRRNLMYNASMISSTGVMPDGMVAYTTGGSTGTRSTVSGSSSTTISGATLPSTGSIFGHYYPSSGTLSGLGRTMTISATVSGITGTNVRATMYVDFVDPQGWIGTALFNTTTNGRFSGTTTLSRTPTGLSAFVWVESLSGSVTGAGATFSDLLIEQGTVAGTFFSGATTDALGWDYAWSGAANASISTAACAATTVRTNLVPNPSLETNILNIASSAGTGGTNALTRETSGGWIGTSFARATWSVGTTAISGNMENVTSATTTVGATYTGSAYVRVNSAQRLVLQATGTSVGTTTATAVDVPANTWTRLSYTHANVTTAGTLNIRVGVSGGRNWVAGDTLDVDGWLLEASSTLGDYFDGSFSPAGDFSYAWTGTANASTSIARGATVTSYSTLNSSGSGYWTASEKYVGSASQKITCVAANAGTYVRLSSLSPSTAYTFSAWVKGEAGKTMYIELVEYSDAGITVTDDTYGPGVTMTGSWQRISLSKTFAAGSIVADIRIRNGSTALHTFYVDAAMLEASPIVLDYFDGSVVSADADLTNSWSGTPHASTSLKRGVGVATVSYFNGVAIQSSGWASTGTKSIRVIPTISDTSSAGFFAVTTTVGQTYTAKAKVRLASPQTGTLNGNARKIVAYNSTISTFLGASNQAPNVAGVTEVSMTFVATTTITNIIFYSGASAGNGDVWLDDFMVVAGTYTGDYFDGNSTDSGNTTYNWTGTANASTSTSLSEMVLYGNPPRATTYTVTNINQPPTKVCTLVIPPEYTLYLGASGTSTGSAGVFIRPIQASDSLYYGPLEELTLLDPNGSVRMNKTLNGATYQAVEIFLMKTDAAAATVTLNSMMAQLYKTGTTPALPTNHYQGEGSTGLMFADDAIVETYQYMHPPRKGIATTLIEVEAWR